MCERLWASIYRVQEGQVPQVPVEKGNWAQTYRGSGRDGDEEEKLLALLQTNSPIAPPLKRLTGWNLQPLAVVGPLEAGHSLQHEPSLVPSSVWFQTAKEEDTPVQSPSERLVPFSVGFLLLPLGTCGLRRQR